MNQPKDPYNLQRFVEAQDPVFETVLAELRAGAKRTHWMWFIFPQLAELGSSPTAKFYGIQSLAEARAYLQHPLLAQRLRTCCEALLSVEGRSAHDIFGSPDDRKLRSSLTLFQLAALGDTLFARCLQKYFDGQPDPRTFALCDRH